MNKNGYDFGKRMSYPSILLPNGQNVIPFDNKSFELLRQGFPPTPSSKFISFWISKASKYEEKYFFIAVSAGYFGISSKLSNKPSFKNV